MRIITPTGDFPERSVAVAARALGLTLVGDTVGRTDVIEELRFEAADGTSVRYLREPELEIPVIVIEGASAGSLREVLVRQLAQVDPTVAADGYRLDASVEVKMTLLRILSAHALEAVTDPMIRAAARAAQDPSPYVRLGVAQLLQYAREKEVADIVRGTLADDPDPDVRDFARAALARFDGAPPPEPFDGV